MNWVEAGRAATGPALRRSAWAISSISLVLLALAFGVRVVDSVTAHAPVSSGSDVAPLLFIVVLQIVVITLGVLIVSREERNSIGWIFVGVGLLMSVSNSVDTYGSLRSGSLPGSHIADLFANVLQGPPLIGIFLFLFLLFPDGRLVSRRWNPVAWAAAATLVFLTLVGLALPGPMQNYPSIRNPLGVDRFRPLLDAAQTTLFLALLALLAAAVLSLVLRFRRSKGDERQQLKWFVSASVLSGVLLLSGPVFWFTPLPHWMWPAAFLLAIVSLLVSIAIAVLKYRLYDIDLLINRSLVYGALSASIIGVYVLVVGYLGNVTRSGNNLVVSLLATALVAVLFQPLREWLQRSVNRLMYGDRDDPYGVISRLGERLEATLSPDAVLGAIVETVSQALKLPFAAIALKRDEEYVVAAATGQPVDEPITLPLMYQQETIGRLLLAPRSAGESLSLADYQLLHQLARQAGIAVHGVRLTSDLQRSREQLVSAREEERRRLRRDLHDGLGPSLGAQTLKVGSARMLYPRDPVAADALLAELERDMGASLAEVRRLVYNLRPPALDELGLVGAIRDSIASYQVKGLASNGSAGLVVSVNAPNDLPALPAAVEVAAYRIVQEAVTNVVRHAKAAVCRIELRLADFGEQKSLELSIVDDGLGLPRNRRPGIGLTSMRERAAELGGACVVENVNASGTCVRATLPLSPVNRASTESSGPTTPETVAPEQLPSTYEAERNG